MPRLLERDFVCARSAAKARGTRLGNPEFAAAGGLCPIDGQPLAAAILLSQAPSTPPTRLC